MAIQRPFAVLPLTLTGIATGNERSNRPASHLALPQYPAMVWQSNGNANLWVRGQFGGAAQAVNFMGIMAATALVGTTFRLRLGTTQAQVDGTAPYDSGVQTFITPARTRADGRFHAHWELPSIVNASWWRIDIGGHTGDFSASSIIMGLERQPARFYNRDRELGFEDLGALEISRNGIVAETPGVVLRTLSFRLGWVSEAEFYDTWVPLFSAKGKRQCLLWCFNPEATVRRQDFTYLGFMARDLFMRGGTAPQQNEVDVQLRAIL